MSGGSLHLGERDQATYPSPELTLGTFSNSYSRRRRRLRPIKTGVESAFFPPKQKHLQLSRRQRRHLSLALCKTKLEGLKMNSFKNVRELLLLSYVNNVVSDREFVLLYDAYQSKNPDFNYQQYEPFNLDNIDSAECKADFRIEKADLPRLAEALQLPPTFHCQQRTVFDTVWKDCVCF